MDDNVRIPLGVVSDALNEADAFLLKAREALIHGRFVEAGPWIESAIESLQEIEDPIGTLAFEERQSVAGSND